MRGWVASVETTHYCLGSAMGPHPFPWMVREFQRVVGDEARAQCRALLDGDDPDVVVACVGGGSNAIGTFTALHRHRRRGSSASRRAGSGSSPAITARRSSRGVPGVVHGMRSLFLQDEYGQVLEATSISAGLDYPGVGPEHAMLAAHGPGRVLRRRPTTEALAGFQLLSATEGIVPALEPAHAIGWLRTRGGQVGAGRLDRARHAVGPGRQGRRPGRRDAR